MEMLNVGGLELKKEVGEEKKEKLEARTTR